MKPEELYLRRCLELARLGIGYTYPNPLVGAVIVYKGKIIGEGYHQNYGSAHAEVNAINSVIQKELLKKSTLYVNLEPCSHYGKTPPCAELIIKSGIPKVVIGTIDPNEKVRGNGIKRLKESGCDVVYPVLEEECINLNRRFFCYHQKKRPYIVLKWAQTTDGFIDMDRTSKDHEEINWITTSFSKRLVHKWRSEEHSIMTGTNTILTDNPQLTVREWSGKNPVRITIDLNDRLPETCSIFNDKAKTIVFKKRISKLYKVSIIEQVIIPDTNYQDSVKYIMNELYKREIQSVLVEGGSMLLQSFIDSGIWDEGKVFTSSIKFNGGVGAPLISKEYLIREDILNKQDVLSYYVKNPPIKNQFSAIAQ